MRDAAIASTAAVRVAGVNGRAGVRHVQGVLAALQLHVRRYRVPAMARARRYLHATLAMLHVH